MPLTKDLITQFVKITNDSKQIKKETFVYGTVVERNGTKYVQLDGSELLTPVATTADTKDGERVTVMIKHHTATITGNASSPSARKDDVDDLDEDVTNVQGTVGKLDQDVSDLNDTITEFGTIIVDKASISDLQAERGRIDDLFAEDVVIKESLTAAEADIGKLQATTVDISGKLTSAEGEIGALKTTTVDISGKLTAAEGEIGALKTDKLDVEIADATYATIKNLDTTNANVHSLEATYGEFASLTTDKLDAIDAIIKNADIENLSAKYANIDFSNIGKAAMEYFYANSGLIDDVVIGDGTITGRLVGVTISGDLIEGNTVVAEKLVIKGSDGLYYKLNTDGITVEKDQTDYNSLNGSIIKAKSITATKIDVEDLVAFGATIGGFHITDSAIYSGTKESVENTTRGIFFGKDGQFAVGDTSNFLKFYKDANGNYKLTISAESILLGSSKKSVETAINDVKTSVDNVEVGGRNLLLKSETKTIQNHSDATSTSEYGVEVTEWNTTDAMRLYGTGGTSTIFGTLGGTSNQGPSTSKQPYVASIYIKNNHATNPVTISANHMDSTFVTVQPLGVMRVELVGVGNGWGYQQFNFKTAAAGDEFDITYWHPKLEVGNKPTDWTPAPEDMATNESLSETNSLATEARNEASTANSLIAKLQDSISMLVTDGNGTSLMTQTEDGWTFSTAKIQESISDTSDNLNKLTNELGDTNGTVDVLRNAVDELGAIAEYVKIGTYEDEPCIELGESDSDFRLLITNTRMLFMEGSSIVAHVTNQSLHIKKAIIEEELQQGGFLWKIRANGNLGLTWKGVTS